MALLARVAAILSAPAAEWPVIEREETRAIALAAYVAALAAIPAVAGFVGASLVGTATSAGVAVRVPALAGLLGAVVEYALVFVSVLVVAVIINLSARWFGAQPNFHNALKLSVYSFTPYWIAGVFLLLPGLRFLSILGLYGACLAWTGLARLMRSPPDNLPGYAATVVVSAVVVTLIAIKLPDMLLAHPRLV